MRPAMHNIVCCYVGMHGPEACVLDEEEGGRGGRSVHSAFMLIFCGRVDSLGAEMTNWETELNIGGRGPPPKVFKSTPVNLVIS